MSEVTLGDLIPGAPFKIKKYFLSAIQILTIIYGLVQGLTAFSPELIVVVSAILSVTEIIKLLMKIAEDQGLILATALGFKIKKKK